MKLERIEAIPVRVPRLERFLPRTAHGQSTASEYVVLRLFADDGTEGLGEVTCSPRWNGEEAAGTVALIESRLNNVLKGVDPLDWNEAARRIDGEIRGRPFLRAGIEMALLDLAGKELSVPAASLLGGPLRHTIATKIVLPGRDVATVRAMCQDLQQYDPETVKVKVGLGVDGDADRVRAVREALGAEVALTVDANEGWTPSEARRALPLLEESGVVAVEQPLSRTAWTSTAQLRSSHSVAFVADESLWTLDDLLRCHESGAFDTVSIYPGKCGGLRRSLWLGDTAQALGLEVTFGSNLELGIGAAAMAHVVACCASISDVVPSDLIGPLYFESSLVLSSDFVTWKGAEVPDGDGLGISLDNDALENYRVA